MTVPRAVAGNIGGGLFGLKTSLPGVNALTADATNSELFSFNSQWTNMLRTSQISVVALPSGAGFTEITHSLGYRPIAEARLLTSSGTVVSAEHIRQVGSSDANRYNGSVVAILVTDTIVRARSTLPELNAAGDQAVVVIYKNPLYP